MAKRLLYTTLGKLTPETEVYVNASFSSWKKYGFDVVVFGEDFHKELCDIYGFILDLNYEKSEFNLPIVRNLLQKGLDYKGYDLYCYLNSDIIFTSDPNPYLDKITYPEYMAVGQRLDVWGYPNITKEEIHNPGGIDYFFHTPNFTSWDDMPDFTIARGRFDHWIMGKALESNHPVIDLTEVFLPLHPEPINRMTGDFNKLYAEQNYKVGYQIYRNNYYFITGGKHGQTNMTPLIMKEEGLVNREVIPLNEFKKQYEFNIRV